MTLNRELFAQDPTSFVIPNDGVTKVLTPGTAPEWDVLQYELRSFVCEGAYAEGLTRILESYVRNAGRSVQPAVWVSGFYGSGKSHLVRVLQHLWIDTTLPSGSPSRSLVDYEGHDAITDALREITQLGSRWGATPWAAGGTLATAASGDVNLGFLEIVLRAAGFPTTVAPTRLLLWLREQGVAEAVQARLEAGGHDLTKALAGFHLDVPLSEAIMAEIPHQASSPAELRAGFKAQFPDAKSLTVDDTVTLLRDVLTHLGNGVIPPTLVVLDEVQQFIDDDGARAIDVQRVVEAVTSQLEGRVLVVATGQQDVTATAVLQKIQDRFSVKVHLASQDVDTVVRRVLLRKDPTAVAALKAALEAASGEIDKELGGSSIKHTGADDAHLAADYPLLPSRRRFWEHVLRQADANGRAGQLRSQLRVVDAANKKVAEREVGTVIGADFLYEDKQHNFQSTGRLLKELQTLIAEQARHEDHGPLRARLLGTIFLISQLPTEGAGDTGIRATAAHLADLLVEDLAEDPGILRQRVPALLDDLTSNEVIQQTGDEYRLQTGEGREWGREFQQRRAAVRGNPGQLESERRKHLTKALEAVVPPRITQGVSAIARRLGLQLGDTEPQLTDGLAIWVRSEWDGVTAASFRDLTRTAGNDSTITFVHLPRVRPEELRETVLDLIAAEETISSRPFPTTDEGKEAREAMGSRARKARSTLDGLVTEVIGAATVELGGGSAVDGANLGQKISDAAQLTALRRFPEFAAADDKKWASVVARLREGNTEPLGALGFTAPPESHPVVKKLYERVGASWQSGKSLAEVFEAAPFGWGLDAVRGALGTLVAAGLIAARDGSAAIDGRTVAASPRFGKLDVRRESAVVTTSDKVAARKLAQDLGVTNVAPDQPSAMLATNAVRGLVLEAATVSGDAPLPQIGVPQRLRELEHLGENELVLAFVAARDTLVAFHSEIAALVKRRAPRLSSFALAQRLADSAQSLGVAEQARERLAAIRDQRSLLDETDPLPPVAHDLETALRATLIEARDAYEAERATKVEGVEGDETWDALTGDERVTLLARFSLAPTPPVAVGTVPELLSSLAATPPGTWRASREAVSSRVARLREELVHRRTPRAVSIGLPGGTLQSGDDVEAYLSNLRNVLTDSLAAHEVVAVRPS